LQLQSALVTYVTAGYPTAQDTPDIMLGMEAGGAGMLNEQLTPQKREINN
jgi:tryptophan synthase alpha subunit